MWLRVKTWISQYNFSSRYQSLAYTFTNFFVALIALNMLLGLFLRLTDPAAQSNDSRKHVDLRAYRGLPSERLRQVLNDFDDFAAMGSVYRPYTQIGDPPFESPSLNVLRDEYGFEYRKGANTENNEAPVKIFLFGGSTSFGVHLADEWTLGAKLQEILGEGVSVRNYSVRSFSWYQTHILFQRLLHAGNTPQLAIFIDGASIQNNGWSRNYPTSTWKAARLWEEAQQGVRHTNLPEFIPLFKVLNILNRNRVEKKMSWVMEKRYAYLKDKIDLEAEATKTKKSYLETLHQREAVASTFGVTPYFVWQPNAAYECSDEKQAPEEYSQLIPEVYKSMRWVRETHFLNLSNLCKKSKVEGPLFVDNLHYSPAFTEELAQ
ncbi:MAG: hypothetical protein KDD39_09930, partial [Bdellovibrionales bacterium]|nr:hypothetical protein [Bdellovibrionales bacterium]